MLYNIMEGLSYLGKTQRYQKYDSIGYTYIFPRKKPPEGCTNDTSLSIYNTYTH